MLSADIYETYSLVAEGQWIQSPIKPFGRPDIGKEFLKEHLINIKKLINE